MARVASKGLRLKQHKSAVIAAPAAEYAGKVLRVPMKEPCSLAVTTGDYVRKYTLLGVCGNGAKAFSPCAARVGEISGYEHPALGRCLLVQLLPAPLPQDAEPAAAPKKADLSVITDPLDGVPLSEKIREMKARGVRRVAADAVQDQPYVCSESAAVYNRAAEVAAGLRIIAGELGLDEKDASVYVYKSKAFDSFVRPEGFPLVFVSGKYPARMGFMEENGAATGFVGARACADLARYAATGEPQISVTVTVSGPLLRRPANVTAPVGTPIGELLDLCDPAEEPGMTVIGGPMNGKHAEDLGAPLCFGMESVLLLEPVKVREIANCWGCGLCSKVCPRDLMPLYIARFSRHRQFAECELFGAESCAECGCCSYVCGGGVEPMMFISEAKRAIAAQKGGGGKDSEARKWMPRRGFRAAAARKTEESGK